MKKTFQEFLEGKNLSKEAFDVLSAEDKAKHYNDYNTELKTYIETLEKNVDGKVSKDELEKAISDFKANQIDHMKSLNEALKEQGLAIQSLSENGAPTTAKTLASLIKDAKQKIQAIAKGSSEEVVLKADTNRASIDGNTSAMRLNTIGQLGTKVVGLYDVIRKVTVSESNNQGVIKYIDWDEDTTVRAAAMVAEGAVFPESTAKFKEYNITIRKIGDTLPVTEEFFEDEERAAGELERFLEVNVDQVRDNELINGDNTGQRLKGLLASVPAYVPVASAISDANIYDLVKKVRTDITKNRGSKYRPNMVVMNSDTADKLHLKKDANENYIFRDVMNIGEIQIIIDNHLADNNLVVGDSRFATIYEKAGISLAKGEVDKQFVEDMMTIKARKRLAFLIRTVDATGFRKVTDIDAALTILEAT
jgi:HK97 family phage major capsid protein